MFFKAGREHPSRTWYASKTSSVRPFLAPLVSRAAVQLLWLQAAPGTHGQEAGEQAAGQPSAASNSMGPGVHYPSCLGQREREWYCSWEPSVQGACSPLGGQMCGASRVYLQTSWDVPSHLFTIVYLYGLRGRWIKNNYISEQEGSKKLVKSGAEERMINDFVFV